MRKAAAALVGALALAGSGDALAAAPPECPGGVTCPSSYVRPEGSRRGILLHLHGGMEGPLSSRTVERQQRKWAVLRRARKTGWGTFSVTYPGLDCNRWRTECDATYDGWDAVAALKAWIRYARDRWGRPLCAHGVSGGGTGWLLAARRARVACVVTGASATDLRARFREPLESNVDAAFADRAAASPVLDPPATDVLHLVERYDPVIPPKARPPLPGARVEKMGRGRCKFVHSWVRCDALDRAVNAAVSFLRRHR